MFSGCQRKMYYIRDTRSRLFREAYFVLREGADVGGICENDLAAEADRILRERFPAKTRRWRKPKHFSAVMFAVGIAVGIALMKII